jgi:hypothetical protein
MTRRDIEGLRARAANYLRQSERAQNRAQLRLYGALATHLEQEAREIEHLLTGSARRLRKGQSLGDAAAGGLRSSRERRALRDAGRTPERVVVRSAPKLEGDEPPPRDNAPRTDEDRTFAVASDRDRHEDHQRQDQH